MTTKRSELQDVGLAIKRLQWRHHREANRRLAEVGLSLVQWDVLRHLAESPGASLHDLATLTFQTDQSMGELARRMTVRGLLARTPGPGRAVRHELTTQGEAARVAGSGVFDEVLAESLKPLTRTELTQIRELLLSVL